ncbi:MAG: hypothetical protein ABJN42_08580 [Roseibium sp.]|uniref:hypothetical protein n=1 Tax=Roseibium sp. TaxID=1936156 RepID=UPI0032989589
MSLFHKGCAQTLAAVLAAACALPAVTFAQTKNSSLQEYVEEFSADKEVDRVFYTDIDADNIQEALIILKEEHEGMGHQWFFIHDKSGSPEIAFNWTGNAVKVVPDEAHEDRLRRVIFSDEMLFGYGHQDSFRPLNHLEKMNRQRVGPITKGETEALIEAGKTTYSNKDTQVFRFDVFPDHPGTEKVVMVRHESFRDGDMLLPYFILGAENQMIHEGLSLFSPYLYTHASGGLSIIEQTLDSFSFTYVPSPETAED